MSKPSLAGWRRVVVDGGVMLLPADPTVGLLRIRSREPLRPLAQIIAEHVRAGLAGLPVEVLGKPRVIGTNEGEFAALVELGAQSDTRAARRYLGVIAGDEYLAVIDGRVNQPAQFELYRDLVERLTMAHCMGLGSDRWRRFYYRAPRGWDGVARHRADVWLAPGYPRNPGVISVFHARPEHATQPTMPHSKLFEELTSEYSAAGPSEPRPVQTDSGLVGQSVFFEAVIEGVVRRVANVGFGDGRYVYVMRLETDDAHKDANTDAFMKVFRTVESLPWPRQDLEALVHWTD